MGFEAAVGPLGNQNVVGTIGTVQSQNVGPLVYLGTIGTILSPVTVVETGTIGFVGTIGTILSEANSQIGTVGTIGSPVIVATLQSPVGETPTGHTFATVSATILGTSGTLFGVVAANTAVAGTVAATLLLRFSGTNQMEILIPTSDIRGFMLDRGMGFTGSLVASIMGEVNASFLF